MYKHHENNYESYKDEDGGNGMENEFDKFIKDLHKQEFKEFEVSDMIMWLLRSSDKEIFGRISFFKQLFLLWNELIPPDMRRFVNDPMYIPYNFGPYSFFTADIMEELNINGIIDVSGRKNSRLEKFSLTEKGKMIADESIERIPIEFRDEFINELKERRIAWDQIGNRGLLDLVYNRYPEYAAQSVIKNKINKNIWDCGRFG